MIQSTLAGALLVFVCLCAPAAAFSENVASPASVRAPASSVRKGLLPQEAGYWDYNRWYTQHTVVSLVVSGRDSSHLAEVLEEVKELAKRNVLLGSIVISGGSNFAQLDPRTAPLSDEPAAYSFFYKNMRRAGRTISPAEFHALRQKFGINPALPRLAGELHLEAPRPVENAEQFFTSLGIENSPTWIVRYQGKNYVYEGVKKISRYFTNQGQFTYVNALSEF